MAAAAFSKRDPPPSRLIPVKTVDAELLKEGCTLRKIPQYACSYHPKERKIECEPFFRAMLSCPGRNNIEVTPWTTENEDGRLVMNMHERPAHKRFAELERA